MTLTLVHYNSPGLREKGVRVETFDTELRKLASAMIEAMQSSGGIGLAAQQIGQAIQLCVVDLRASTVKDYEWELDGARPPLDLFMPMVMVNPEITFAPRNEIVIYEEGCLSFPKTGGVTIRGDVERPDKISVNFQDEHGVAHLLKTNGLLSRCIQHEVDHLHGTLFIDRMEKRVRAKVDQAIKELAANTKATSTRSAPEAEALSAPSGATSPEL